ncbi:MAG: inositol monophosphatase family protein [Chloroflexi bacterium]|nr:inositol monophosphatase family protein [Chloroflexota bacterium]
MRDDLEKHLNFARETAYHAGQLTLEYFQKGLQPDRKADNSPVTMADRKCEEWIRGAIERHYPGCAVLGEEYGSSNGPAERRWIIDPIDGTQSFIHGVPLYSVLIALEIEGNVEVGVAYFPALDEMISAASGLGCWWNGRRAHVSEVAALEQAAVAFTDIGNFCKHGGEAQMQRLLRKAWYRAGWGDAYGYMLVATGRAEVMIDPIMEVWDCAPFPPILREAGGYFGDWAGNETIYAKQSMATSLMLLPEVLRTLKSERGEDADIDRPR